VSVAVAAVVGDEVGLGPTESEGNGVPRVDPTHDETRSAHRAMSGTSRLFTSSAWLLEHSTTRVEPAIRVLLEDPLASLGVEAIVLPLISQPDRMIAEWLLADHAARHGHYSSSMSGWRARTS
jgi:hypothetical protein